MDRFRILSLDGGGIKGTFTAALLAQVERITQKNLVDYFDLITGTSTGGIIALAMGLGISLDDVLRFYVTKGPEIFPCTGIHRRVLLALRHALRPKYSQQVLRECLAAVFGNRKLGESKCRLVIPSFDIVSGAVHLFKTAHHSRFKEDFMVSAVDVAMATAAAPTYFPAYKRKDGLALVDGGIWANCPAAVGIVEAIGYLGKSPDEIELLSVGTTSSPYCVPGEKGNAGWLIWNKELFDLQMHAQASAALAHCSVLTNHRLLRVDSIVKPGRFSLDDSENIDQLRALGQQTARHKSEEIEKQFLGEPSVPFKPYHEVTLCQPAEPTF